MRYKALIRKLSEQTTISDWESVALSQHLVVDGSTVGLIPKGESDMVVYVDLGHRPGAERRLLEHNACASDEVPGCFVIVPNSGNVAYRFDVSLESLERTASLSQWLLARVRQARTADALPANT
jgi:hypothetical protein